MADPENLSLWQWLLVKDNSAVVRNYGFLVAAIIGFPFLIRRTCAASRSAKAALKQAGASARQSVIAAKQLEIAADQSIAEAFTRAITHLGDKKLEIRIGGIYALARIARDSKKDHWPIMEILTAFVRQNAPWKEGDKPEEKPSPPKPDIQTILTVLGRRERAHEKGQGRSLDLRNTDLGMADLKWALLQGADLQRAYLQGADLQGAFLQGAYLLEAYLLEADLHGAHLQGADLLGAHLQGAYLYGADLQGADLYGAYLERADLKWADLKRADLQEADLKRAHLQRADLKGADLQGADLEGAYLHGADLQGADLEGVDLSQVLGLTKEQIESAIRDDKTKLPDRLRPSE